jgi:hypothetical protein
MPEEHEADTKSAAGEEEATDFSFDPGSQVELEVERTCCITGEEVKYGFCRFPDYVRGTMMVMSKKAMLEHLRAGDSVASFRKVLVARHGPKVLEEHYSNY